MSRTRIVCVVSALAAVLGVAAWWLHRPKPVPPRRATLGGTSWVKEFEGKLPAKDAPAPRPQTLRYRLPAGTVLTYQAESESSVSIQIDASLLGAATQPQKVTYSLAGTLEIASYASTEEGVVLGYRLRDVAVDASSGDRRSEESALASLAADAGRETLVEATARGEVRGIWFPKEMGAYARNLLKSVILQTRLILPQADESAWEAIEEDATGRYRARYSVERTCATQEATLARVRRERAAWIELYRGAREAKGGKESAQGTTSRGATVGYFDVDAGRWRVIEADEGLEVEKEGVTMEANTRARVRLLSCSMDAAIAAQGASRAAALREAGERRGPGGMEGAEEVVRGIEEQEWRQLVNGETADGLLGALAQPPSGDQGDALFAATMKLSALVRLDPKAAGVVLEWLRAGRLSGDAQLAAVSALGNAGTPEAQRCLVAMVKGEEFDGVTREWAIQALSCAESPEPSSIDALRGAASAGPAAPLAAPSAVALGAIAHHLAEDDETRAGAITSFLREAAGAASPEWRRVVADALGNAGTRDVSEAVLRLASDGDAEVRSAAAFSLRFLEGAEVDRRLGALLDDPEAGVRASAAQALGYRSGTESDALLERAATHTDEAVRRSALSVLGARASSDPSALERVRRMLAEDPSPAIRRLAAEVLSGAGQRPR